MADPQVFADGEELDLTNSHLPSLEDVGLPPTLKARACYRCSDAFGWGLAVQQTTCRRSLGAESGLFTASR